MPDVIQVHAFLPRQLKRRAFSVLAQQERKFSHWLRDALEEWLQEVEQPRETKECADVDQWKQKNGMAGSVKGDHVQTQQRPAVFSRRASTRDPHCSQQCGNVEKALV